MTEHELKPCPFCNSSDIEFACDDYQRIIVRCNGCYATGPRAGRLTAAQADAWNKRAQLEYSI